MIAARQGATPARDSYAGIAANPGILGQSGSKDPHLSFSKISKGKGRGVLTIGLPNIPVQFLGGGSWLSVNQRFLLVPPREDSAQFG
jgi:hypothetical protein